MVRAISFFMEFCYLVRREALDENDISKIELMISRYHEERSIFQLEGIRPDGFSLPRQHSIVHYPHLIQEFRAPNGLCSSITESKHIKAVKEAWQRTSRFEALGQMLVINQRLDKIAAARVEFRARGMLSTSLFADDHRQVLPPPLLAPPNPGDEDDDGEAIDGEVIAEVKLATKPGESSRVSSLCID